MILKGQIGVHMFNKKDKLNNKSYSEKLFYQKLFMFLKSQVIIYIILHKIKVTFF